MSWGSFINNITGASYSAKQQYNYNLALQQQNQAWQTEMANTAHQREVADLEKAGLNPILSAGGGGADTGSPGGGGVGGGVPQNPLEILGTAINAYAGIQQTKNNTAKTNADITNETEMTKANVAKALAEAGYTQKQIDYYIKYGVFPGATVKVNAGGSLKGPFGSGISIEGGGEIPIGLHVSPETAKKIKNENDNFNKKHKSKELPKGLKGLW